MALPFPSPFTSNTKVTKAQLDQGVLAINQTPFGLVGSATNGGTVTLATIATDYAGLATVTFTVPTAPTLSSGPAYTTRTYRIEILANYRLGTTTGGKMHMQIGYNTGASVVIGSVTKLGVSPRVSNYNAVTGDNGATEGTTWATIALTPGTQYTFYPAVQRVNGGSASDVAANFALSVYDEGGA